MKSKEEDFRKVLKGMMGASQAMGSFTAKVVAIDEDNLTVDVATDEAPDAPFYNVRLKSIVSAGNLGIVPIPKVDSYVICSLLDRNERTLYTTMVGEIDKLYIDTDAVKIELLDALHLNGDKYEGMVIWEKLQPELDKMSKRIDGIINAIKSGVPAPNDGGTALQTSIKVTLETLQNVESFSDSLINKTIKHGD